MTDCDWKQFQFKIIEVSDLPRVLGYLRQTFYLDEPLNIFLGTSEGRQNDLDRLITNCVQEGLGLCTLATEKESNKVAGVAIQSRNTRGQSVPTLFPVSPITQLIRDGLNIMYDKVNLYDRYQVEEFAHISILSVSQEFRGLGLANEFCKRCIALCKAKNFKLIDSIFSNPFSRKVGLKHGFDEVNRISFSELKESVQIADLGSPGEDFLSHMVLRI